MLSFYDVDLRNALCRTKIVISVCKICINTVNIGELPLLFFVVVLFGCLRFDFAGSNP